MCVNINEKTDGYHVNKNRIPVFYVRTIENKFMKILFPTDFSEAANHAFIYALSLADKLKAEILTIHVYKRPDIRALHLPRTLNEVYRDMELQEFEEYRASISDLQKLIDKRGQTHIPIRHILAEGEITRQILRAAKKESIDFIVIGTKGAGWLKQIFIGTIAAEVMENACCPVLAVPNKAVFDGKINKIGVTTSFDLEEAAVMKKALKFARIFNADLHCLHVNVLKTDSESSKEDAFKALFKGVKNLKFEILEGVNIHKTLSEYVEKNGFDMLAMLSHKRNFLEELMTYNEAKMMTYRSKTPVLAFHA